MHTSTGIKYVERFGERVIKSGFEVEYYQYKDKPVVRGYIRLPRKKKKANSEKKENPEKTKFSVNRTRTEIRRRVNSNPQLMKFLTLTTTNVDISITNKAFNLFTQRMKDRFPEFRYLAVPEFQKDIDHFGKIKPLGGAVHYHLLCNLRYLDQKVVEKIWGQGFIKLRRVKHVDNLGRYVCKYLHKDMFDKRMFGKKKFFCSQDLEKSREFVGEEARLFMKHWANSLKFIREFTFEDEYRGEILYKVFNLKNFTYRNNFSNLS